MNQRTFGCQMTILIIGGGFGGLLIYMGRLLVEPIWSRFGLSMVLTSVGMFAMLAGIEAMLIRKVGFVPRRSNYGTRERYTSFTTQLWGILFIVAAIVLISLGGVNWLYPGGIQAFMDVFFKDYWGWGVLLFGIGLAAIINGMITLLAGSAGIYQGRSKKMERINGILPLFLGFLFVGMALLLIAEPEQVAKIVGNIISNIRGWILKR